MCDCGPEPEATALEHTSERLVYVHDPALCAGRPCTIHHRTDHLMRSFPQHFRQDRGIMERICPYGVGHPDPDDLAWRPATYERGIEGRDTASVHGCCGCCMDLETRAFLFPTSEETA
jgi:hypothetical protein